MGRCGCGTECACEIQPGCGIEVTGSGQAEEDPYEISVNPKTLAGDGLKPGGQECQLAADLAPGGGIEHDTNGALYNAEAAEDFDPSNASVPGLLSSRKENRDIVGAWLTGYWYKPQSTRAAIDWAAERGYDLLHLPVRMLADGTPVITPDEMLGRQNGNTRDFDRDSGVQNQTPARWRRLINKPGTWRPDLGGEGTEDPRQGWFGYLESNEVGLVTLGEAVDLVDRRVPMIWDIMWPALDGDQWADGKAPPKERVEAFIRHLKLLLRRDKANSRVIVASDHPAVPHDGDTLNLFDQVSAANVGVVLRSKDDLDRLSPDALGGSGQDSEGNGTSWVIADKTLPNEQLKGYADAGHNVLLSNLTRHVHVDRAVGPSGAIGVLSGDPEYTAGHFNTHPVYRNYGYKQRMSTFHQPVIHHGWLPTQEQWHNRVHPNQRGYAPRYDGGGHGGQYVIPRQVGNVAKPQYWVLQGWASPVQSDEWVMTLWLNVHRNYEAAGRLVAADVCFCRNTDEPIPSDGLAAAGDKTGYVLSYRTASSGKALQLFAVDDAEGNAVQLKDWDVSGFENNWIAVRIRVLQEGIRVAAINRESGQPETEVYDSAQEQDQNKKRLGTASRGGYLFFGRRVGEGRPGGEGDPESAGFAKVVINPHRDDTPDNPPPDNGQDGGEERPPPGNGDGGNGEGNPPPPPDDGGQQPPPPPPDDGGDEEPPPPPPDNGEGGNQPDPNPPEPEPKPETYTVQSGDTLSGIAQQTGADQQAIADANGIENPDAIQEGDVLKIPR